MKYHRDTTEIYSRIMSYSKRTWNVTAITAGMRCLTAPIRAMCVYRNPKLKFTIPVFILISFRKNYVCVCKECVGYCTYVLCSRINNTSFSLSSFVWQPKNCVHYFYTEMPIQVDAYLIFGICQLATNKRTHTHSLTHKKLEHILWITFDS